MKALGLIEVDGYLAAIIASDAALKSANVKLLGLEPVKSGITCVKLVGEVDAVKASVEAGEKAAKDIGMLRRAHVIARLHEDTAKLLIEEDVGSNDVDDVNDVNYIEEANEAKDVNDVNDNNDNNHETSAINYDLSQQESKAIDSVDEFQASEKLGKKLNYKNMKVDHLRNYVKKLKINNLTNKQIKLMKKVQLIDILDEYFKEKEEGE